MVRLSELEVWGGHWREQTPGQRGQLAGQHRRLQARDHGFEVTRPAWLFSSGLAHARAKAEVALKGPKGLAKK